MAARPRFSAWLLVGVATALIGAIWLLSLTETIVLPVIVAGIIASVTSPLVDWLRRRGIPRGIGAGLVFLAIIAVGIGVGLLVLAGSRARPRSAPASPPSPMACSAGSTNWHR